MFHETNQRTSGNHCFSPTYQRVCHRWVTVEMMKVAFITKSEKKTVPKS